MPNKDRPLVDRHPPKPGGEGWLVNAQEQLVVQFKPDNPSPHAKWVSYGPTAGFHYIHQCRRPDDGC